MHVRNTPAASGGAQGLPMRCPVFPWNDQAGSGQEGVGGHPLLGGDAGCVRQWEVATRVMGHALCVAVTPRPP